MIRIYIGNVGSGKTACMVREMAINQTHIKFYSNIIPKQPDLTPQIVPIKASMLINKEIMGYKKNGAEIVKLELNKGFWQSINEPISVVLDEAHTLLNPRRAMSKANVIMTDWIAMLRRVLGVAVYGTGDLILITQLPQRIDPIARDMCTNVRYHTCHYNKVCTQCQLRWKETSEHPEPRELCPRCKSYKIVKRNYRIEVKHFSSIERYYQWKLNYFKTYHKRYFITDIEKYFPLYNTLQWDNMLSEFY